MEDQITVRLPASLGRALRQTSRRLDRRPSDVVRMALESFLHESPPAGRKPADRVALCSGRLRPEFPIWRSAIVRYVLAALKRAR